MRFRLDLTSYGNYRNYRIQPQRQKSTYVHMRPAKVQISLRIRAVWSNCLLGKIRIGKDAKFLNGYNEDSDQTTQMHWLIWFFIGGKCKKVCFFTLWLNCFYCLRLCSGVLAWSFVEFYYQQDTLNNALNVIRTWWTASIWLFPPRME